MAGSVLSPGLTSYHFSTRVAPRQPSSASSPSMVMAPGARAIRIVSPASADWAARGVAKPSTSTAPIAASRGLMPRFLRRQRATRVLRYASLLFLYRSSPRPRKDDIRERRLADRDAAVHVGRLCRSLARGEPDLEPFSAGCAVRYRLGRTDLADGGRRGCACARAQPGVAPRRTAPR